MFCIIFNRVISMNFKRYMKKMGISTPSEGPFVSAVIVAAGSSKRMNGENKQFIPLCEIPILARTLSAFEESLHVREVVIVTKKLSFLKVASIVKEFGFSKVTNMVVGGETRQESAEFGFKAISKDAEFVAVHDGARPLITSECIDKVIEDAYEKGASAAAVPVKDTLKIADENGFVVSTPDRKSLFAVQTPQVFKVDLYAKALENAKEKNRNFTDDCQLVEAIKTPVHLVEGSYTNIKITTKEDITQAEAILRARGDAF